MPDAAVIISTYNRPSQLARCLEGFRHQSAGDFKILVADVGSRLSVSDGLIYTDADCAPHRDFVPAHLRYRTRRRFLIGRSVKWNAARSAQIEQADIASEARGLPWCPNGLVKPAMPTPAGPADARVPGEFSSGNPQSGTAGAATEA